MRERIVRGEMVFAAILMLAVAGAGILESGCTNGQQNPVSSVSSGTPALYSNPVTGNGAPSGPHYDLNIIGVPKSKTADMTGDNGHRIFVALSGNTKILLTAGPFEVLDANGTD